MNLRLVFLKESILSFADFEVRVMNLFAPKDPHLYDPRTGLCVTRGETAQGNPYLRLQYPALLQDPDIAVALAKVLKKVVFADTFVRIFFETGLGDYELHN